MRRKKKEENDIALIPVEAFEETEDAEGAVPQDVEDNNIEETADTETLEQDTEAPEENTEAPEQDTEASKQDTKVPEQDTEAPEQEPESESSALFGEYVAEENKWERKNRIREEKERAKQEKKRARYADVDDETFESMKAGGARKFFGVLMLLVLIAGIGSASLIVYRLVFAPSYAQVGEKEKNIQVDGLATDSDTSRYEGQEAALQGIATPSDLIDTWVEQPFTPATSTDAQTQDMDGTAVPSDEETQEVTDE
ncbi:MAG: hypothetical protein J6C99_02380 [Lachnospiraceae bacterium]|nr:hypothetical protein [Lachnospiraceae bacterium]